MFGAAKASFMRKWRIERDATLAHSQRFWIAASEAK
jgi:hypothetical protein